MGWLSGYRGYLPTSSRGGAIEIDPNQDAAATVAEAAYASSADVADTIHDAIEANERSDTPDPAVGRLLEEASARAEQSVGRTGWLRRWFRRTRRSGR